jgi:hypothetical protein
MCHSDITTITVTAFQLLETRLQHVNWTAHHQWSDNHEEFDRSKFLGKTVSTATHHRSLALYYCKTHLTERKFLPFVSLKKFMKISALPKKEAQLVIGKTLTL